MAYSEMREVYQLSKSLNKDIFVGASWKRFIDKYTSSRILVSQDLRM